MNARNFFILALLFAVGCAPNPDDVFKQAETAQKDGDYKKAIELYTAVIDARPGNDMAYVNRAACYGAINEPNKMLDDAEKATQINSKNVPALELLATYWHKEGLRQTAEAIAEQLLEADPGNEVGERILRESRGL
ncbi:MAG: hypothetical protein MI757_16995 [Pirellulales bacterium]|nr:hypothetical protein [Pirellulales bacterium]